MTAIDRLRLNGTSFLSDADLLSVILGDSALAERVMKIEETGVEYLTECAIEELTKIPGIGTAKAASLLAAVELGKRITAKPKSKRVSIANCQDLADIFMADMRYMKNECFKVLLLNTKNEVIATHTVSIGTVNSSLVDAREVFKPAIKRGAASVAFAHNHPSGNPAPSETDIEVTTRLIDAGKLLGVNVIDHVIIGDGVFASLRQEGLI